MGSRSPNFVDTATEAVIGVPEYLERLKPDSACAKAAVLNLPLYLSHDEDVWQREMACIKATEAWVDALSSEGDKDAHQRVRTCLAQLPTIERPLRRLQASEALRDVEFFEVKRFLYYASLLLEEARPLLQDWSVPEDRVRDLEGLMDAIHPEPGRTSRFHLASALDPTLEELHAQQRKLHKQERKHIRDLEGAIIADYGGAFDLEGAYRPPSQEPALLDQLAADPRISKQIQGPWRLDDARLRVLEERIQVLTDEVLTIEEHVRVRLSDHLRRHILILTDTLDVLTRLDIRLAKVALQRELNGCWPQWRSNASPAPDFMELTAGREPRVVQMLARSGESAQPVDLRIDARPMVLAGPNMGGKSVLLKLLGICQWCTQHAMPAPAAGFATRPVDSIIYIGPEEPHAGETTEGLSSFGREVRRLVEWWQASSNARLWLLDELGRGTHPDEGAAIAGEVIQKLTEAGDRVVAATHFPRVATLPNTNHLRIAGLTDPDALTRALKEAADDPEAIRAALRCVMDYRPVPADQAGVPRDARRIARALGLDIEEWT